MPDKFLYFDGLRFTRDERTGYYLCATPNKEGKRQRMHVYVWEYYNGKVPEGYHVHHVDEDKSNNDISNLRLLSEFEHLSLHGREKVLEHYEQVIQNLNEKARPKAIEWHKSKSGIEWHKKQYDLTKDKLYQKKPYICQNCGKEFLSTKVGSKYCSNKCKSATRRKSGVDNETRICLHCEKPFICSKYSKQQYCSRECGTHRKKARTYYHRDSK